MVLYGLIIPLFSFMLQIWPRLINKYFGIDTWRHLMFADFVRRNKKLPKKITSRYLVHGQFDYPPLIILFLSFFPKKFADDYQFIFSPIFDFINNYIVFLVALFLTKSLFIAINAQIVATLTPIVVMEASNLSTRVLSYLIFNLSFLPLILYTHFGDIVWLMISAIFLFVLFFTHKLAIQAYLFNILGFSFIERSFFYVLFFVGIFCLVVVFGGDLYKRIFKAHMTILRYWKNNIDLRFAHQFRGLQRSVKTSDFVNRIYNLSIKNPFVYVLGNNPWIFFFLLPPFLNNGVNFSPESFINISIYKKFNYWVFFSLLTSVLILGIKQLRFLGEGSRYVEYCILPLSINIAVTLRTLIGIYSKNSLLIFYGLCAVLLVGILYLQKRTILEDRARTITKELWQIINYLNKKVVKRIRLAVFPFNLGDAMMYFVKGKILTSDSVGGLMKMMDVFPVVTKPMDDIVKKYKLNYVLFDMAYVTLRELKLSKYKIEKKLGGYILISV